MSTITHCPTCAAPIREEASTFCAFCGTKLPEAKPPTVIVVQEWAPTSAERFVTAKQHPDTSDLLAHTPSTTSETIRQWLLASECGLVTLSVGFFTAIAFAAHDAPGLPAVLCSLGLVLCLRLTGAAILRARRFAAAPMWRWIAVVVDERVSITGGKHARATNYASFELEDGEGSNSRSARRSRRESHAATSASSTPSAESCSASPASASETRP